MTKTHAEIRDGLLREREFRTIAHEVAVAERDALELVASGADALPFERAARARANARVGLALHDMRFWGDPLPAATSSDSTAPDRAAAPLGLGTPGAVENTIETLDARPLGCDAVVAIRRASLAPNAPPETVDSVAARVLDA